MQLVLQTNLSMLCCNCQNTCIILFVQRYDVPISQDDADQVMAAADGAIVKVLQAIYDYVHEDAEAQAAQQQAEPHDVEQDNAAADAYGQLPSAMQQPAYSPAAAPQYMQPGSLPYMQQPFAQPLPAAYPPHQQPAASYFPGTAYPPGSGFYPPGPSQQGATAGWPQQQMPMQQAQQAQHAQQMYMSNQGMPQHMQHVAGMGAEAYQGMPQTMQIGTSYHADPNLHGETGVPSIEYDRRPRAVTYKPYTQQDYSSRNYDAKTQKEYWQLGTLGPQIEDEDLQVRECTYSQATYTQASVSVVDMQPA